MLRFSLPILLITTVVRAAPFVIQVVDEQTNRGVPMVDLRTPSNVLYVTDSAGIAAIDEPGYVNQKVFFTIASFGYEFPADGFGLHGKTFDYQPGQTATVKLKRINIAERLYRITGEGIYRDSILAGRKVPIAQPLLNAQVVGSDSVESAVYRGKIHFFWGDTGKLSYGLGNFSTTGAVADLPGHGGLDPSVGIDLTYFTDKTGFARAMAPFKEEGAIWVDEPLVLNDDHGEERMITHFSRMKDLGHRLEHGLLIYNDEKNEFERLKTLPANAPLGPNGHAFKVGVNGQTYFYFPRPYPCVRVKADWKDVTDVSTYEAYTCLKQGTASADAKSQLDRDAGGRVRFSWKQNTPPLDAKQFDTLVKTGKVNRDDLPMRLTDIDTKKPILLHAGSVYWNDYRKKYVMIGDQSFGDSMLGEIYFVEAPQPEGPWIWAKKVVTHHRESDGAFGKTPFNMDFYNPTQHPYYDQQGGKIIYFEGTYTHMFSGNPEQTPRYEYNQQMYRLDLSDPRLKLP